jgi:hypothetical protein
MNSAIGNQIPGRRIFSRETSIAASANPSRICDAAMEKRMATADANVSHRAAKAKEDRGKLMGTEISVWQSLPNRSVGGTWNLSQAWRPLRRVHGL